MEPCHRNQPSAPGGAQQDSRIDVGLPDPGAEVERGTGGADDVARPDSLPRADRNGAQARVARPHAVGVRHCDMPIPAHLPGEGHDSRRGRPDGGTRTGGVLQTSVARRTDVRGRAEGVDHRSVDRRSVGDDGDAVTRRCGPGAGRRCDTQHSGTHGNGKYRRGG